MNTPTEREVVKRRFEFIVESPAIQRDIYDALFVAGNRLNQMQGAGANEYDDALHVEARDDEIVVWFEREDD